MSPPLVNVSGVVFLESRTLPGIEVEQHYYQFTGEADRDTVLAVLVRVSADRDLIFYDAEHPQLTEPGAHITLVRSPDGLLAKSGGHGWSSRWVPITDQEAERYLESCIPYNSEPASERLTFSQPSNWRRLGSVSRSRWNSFRRYLNKRLKSR